MQNQGRVDIISSHWSHQQALELLECYRKRSRQQFSLGTTFFFLAIIFWFVALPLFGRVPRSRSWLNAWMICGFVVNTSGGFWLFFVRGRQHQKIDYQALDLLTDGLTHKSLNDCLVLISERAISMNNARFSQRLIDVLQRLTPETAKLLTPRAWEVLGHIAKRNSSELAQTVQRVLQRLNPSVLSEVEKESHGR